MRFPQVIHRTVRALLKIFLSSIRHFAIKFLRLLNSHDDAGRSSCGFNITATAKNPHPAFKGFAGESGFLFDLAIGDRAAAKHKPDAATFASFTKHEPAEKPHGLAHASVVAGFKEDAAKARVVILPAQLVRHELQHFQHTPQ